MRRLLIILLLFFSKAHGQTAINSISLDTTGQLHWSITVMEKDDPTLVIQKKVADSWITIKEWKQGLITNSFVYPVGMPEPTHKSIYPYTYSDAAFVPVDKGLTTYRMIMKNVNPQLTSNEVSINRLTPLKMLYAKGDFISLEDYVGCKILNSNGTLIKTIARTNFLNISDLKKGSYYIITTGQFGELGIYQFEKN